MIARKFKPLSPQRRKVLAALAHGSTVSKLTAVHQRVGNINDVIRHLRLRGWDIQTVTGSDINGDEYTKYSLAPSQRQAATQAASVTLARAA